MSTVNSGTSIGRLPKLGRRQVVWLIRVILIFSILGFWQLATLGDDYLQVVFSSPYLVAQRLVVWLADPKWWGHLGSTLQGATLGYLLGVTVALALVALVTPSPWLSAYAAPFIAVLNSLPKIALAPLFIFWFGIALQSKVYFVASTMCFIVFYGIHTGLRSIDPVLRDNTRVLGASNTEMLMHLYAPAILTWIISSLRLSLTFALLAAVVSEYLGSIHGIGYLIQDGQLTLRTDILIAGIFVIAIISITLDRALLVVEKYMSRWRAF